MSFLKNRFVRTVALAGALGASTLGLDGITARDARAADAGASHSSLCATAQSTQQTFTYYLPVLANLHGANNSEWRSTVRFRVLGTPGVNAHYTIQAHPRGQQAQPSDPTSGTYTACGSCSQTFTNILDNLMDASGQPMHLTGAYWGEVKSDTPLGIDSSTTSNHSSDGSNQGGDYETLDARTVWTNPHLAHRGDIIEFPLDGTSQTRENLILFALPVNTTDYSGPTISVNTELLDMYGNTIDGASTSLTPGEFVQFSPLAPALTNGKTLNPGDVLRLRLGQDGGTGDFLLYANKSEVDNVITTSQDPSNKTGYIIPLVQSGEYTTVPSNGETGDNFNRRIHAKLRSGAMITGVHVDYDSDGTYEEHFTGLNTNEYTLESTFQPLAAYNANPTLEIDINDNNVYYSRTIKGNNYAVTQATPYTVDAAVANPIIRQNLDAFAHQASYGLYDLSCLSESDARMAFDVYSDGNQSNGEAQGYYIDKANGVFTITNVDGHGNDKAISRLPSDSMRYFTSMLPRPQQ